MNADKFKSLNRIKLLFIFCLSLSFQTVHAVDNLDLSQLHESRLLKPLSVADKLFGSDLSLSRDFLAVAAKSRTIGASGSVYLYKNVEHWPLLTELNSNKPSDGFASSLLLQDDFLFVSADRDDEKGSDSGAVYIYQLDNQQWFLAFKLTAPESFNDGRFGSALAYHEGMLFVGALGHQQGVVYGFVREPSGNWRLQLTIKPEDQQAARFGAAIGVNGNTLAIGAPYTDADNSAVPNRRQYSQIQARFQISKGEVFDPGIESGAIFVYENINGEWIFQQRLNSSIRESNDHLGEKLIIKGDLIAAAVRQKDVFDFLRAGMVYLYRRNKGLWEEDIALYAVNANVGGNFGVSMAATDQSIFIGSDKLHVNGFNSGQGYLFSVDVRQHDDLLGNIVNQKLSAHDQFSLASAMSPDQLIISSLSGVYIFDHRQSEENAAYHSDVSALSIDNLWVDGMGSYQVQFHLHVTEEGLVLRLSSVEKILDQVTEQAVFSLENGQISIKRLALISATNQKTYLNVVLQLLPNQQSFEFILTSATAAKERG